jgi:fatty acid desaturase
MEERSDRAFLASVDAQTRAQLTETSNVPGLLRLGQHLGAAFALGALIVQGVPGWPLLMLPQGVLLVFLFTPLHETTHATPFRAGWLNTLVGRLCGFLIGIPFTWFRWFHLAHHRFTQDPARDPELAHAKPETVPAWLLHVSGLPVWWGNLGTLVRNAAGRCDDDYVPERVRPEVTREARVMLRLYTLIAILALAGPLRTIALWGWVVPCLIGQPFLRFYLLAEHGRCPLVADMFENTRTTYTAALVRFIAWNMPYHAEHHAWPTVPFHRLPELHRLARPHLRQTERGYVRFSARYIAGMGRGESS